MVKNQKGFTLIELMIVIAIIGILAAVAVPQYGQYTKRAKFADVISQTNAMKTAVSVCYQENNVFDTCGGPVATAYPGTGDIGAVGNNIASIVSVGGNITATGTAAVDGSTYTLNHNVANAGDPIAWSVASTSTCIAANTCRP